MDFNSLGDWLSNEIGVALHVSFWLALGVVAFVVWRAMEWRYAGIIERLRDEVEHLRHRRPEPPAPSPLPAPPETRSIPIELREPVRPPPRASRVFVGKEVTPDFLMDLFKGHTSAQARKLAEPYLGKWMRLKTKVQNVYPTDGMSFHVCGGSGLLSSRTLWFTFGPTELARVDTLTIGETIRVAGMISKVGMYEVEFSFCEFAG